MIEASVHRAGGAGRTLGAVADLVLIVVAAVIAGAAAYTFGFVSVVVLGYLVMLVAAILVPRGFAIFLISAVIIIEPGAIVVSGNLAPFLYQFPPGWDILFPVTIDPHEFFILVTAGSLAARRPQAIEHAPRMPLLAWAVPVMLAAGMAYGLYKGAPDSLVYNEARGIIYGIAVFYIAWRMRDTSPRTVIFAVFAATTALSVILLYRYVTEIRLNQNSIPNQFAFTHEAVIFLGIGAIVGAVMLLRVRDMQTRLLLVAYLVLVIAAMMATGRRSGTLVFLIAALVSAWLLLPKRPALVLGFTAIMILLGGVYLGAYWNKTTGAAAQPARAIRSSIDPAPRDISSDSYRDLERANVLLTIEANRPLGIGFGAPFYRVHPLPELPWWSLQFHTPHTNLLWLWLKMGLLGASVFLGTWVIAMARCVRSIGDAPRRARPPMLPLVLAGTLAMYMAFAEVDLVLTGTRPIAPLAIALALALTMPLGTRPRADAPARAPARGTAAR